MNSNPQEKKENDYLPHYTVGEEIFNSVSHGLGVALACVGFGVLIVFSVLYGNGWAVASSIVYCLGLLELYLASTLYHAATNRTVKGVLQILDHCSIFVLIAATYTPFTLITLHGEKGWLMFGVVWAMAIFGIILNAIDVKKYSKLSMVCYILMGWAILTDLNGLMTGLSKPGVILLVLGGVSYTFGILFYALRKRYMHSIWHLFVLGGSVLHFLCIALYVIPTTF